MTQKELDQAANEYDESLTYSSISEQYDVKKAFIAGAKWRIDFVWHDIKEMPENNRMILIIMQHDIPTVIGPDNTFFREEIKDRHIQRWAYIEDLLPIKED